MKTYNQFIVESDSARENIQEIAFTATALGLAKLASMGLSAYSAYSAAKNLKKGKYGDAALDALGVIPGGVAFKGARALGAGRNLAKGASATQSVVRNFSPNARNRAIEKGFDIGTKALLGTGAATAKPTQPAAKTEPTAKSQPAATQPAKTRVLSKLKGVQGTGVGKNFVAKKWTSAESDRYKRVAAQNAKKATPKPAPVVRSNNINLPSGAASGTSAKPKPVVKESTPVGDTIKTKVNSDSSIQVTQKRSKDATDKIKKSLDMY